MKQVTRASVDTAASHRKAQLLKQNPDSRVSYIMDDAVPRALIEVFKQDKLSALEFVESVDTVGKQDNMEDYRAATMEFGLVTIHFPEAIYSRDIALTIFNDILSRLKAMGAGLDTDLHGFVYAENGTFKKVR
jgi:hypothetical protein